MNEAICEQLIKLGDWIDQEGASWDREGFSEEAPRYYSKAAKVRRIAEAVKTSDVTFAPPGYRLVPEDVVQQTVDLLQEIASAAQHGDLGEFERIICIVSCLDEYASALSSNEVNPHD